MHGHKSLAVGCKTLTQRFQSGRALLRSQALLATNLELQCQLAHTHLYLACSAGEVKPLKEALTTSGFSWLTVTSFCLTHHLHHQCGTWFCPALLPFQELHYMLALHL